jgi:hypothetical protein
MKYSNTKDKTRRPKKLDKAAGYLWNYAKMSGLFPNFDKKGKPNKESGGEKK